MCSQNESSTLPAMTTEDRTGSKKEAGTEIQISSENKKKKELSTTKLFFILFFYSFCYVILNINDAKILVFQFIFDVFFSFQLVITSSTAHLSLSHFVKCVHLKPKSKCISCF